MSRITRYGGIAASIILIAFGIGSIVIGLSGRSDVGQQLKQEQITGTPDMTPAAIRAEVQQAGLTGVKAPSCSVAGQPVDSGAPARCFAQYMRIHALEATGGKTYAQMPRYATANGKGTDDPKAAQKRPDGTPVDNPARNVWINETALSTALNTSYFAQRVALFSIIMGIALLLTGIGFLVLTLELLRRRTTTAPEAERQPRPRGAVPAAG